MVAHASDCRCNAGELLEDMLPMLYALFDEGMSILQACGLGAKTVGEDWLLCVGAL